MDADVRKTTLRTIPYGLYVLTSVNGDSTGAGTVNWVSQMAFDPPLLAIRVKDGTASLTNIKAGGAFAMSFLGSGQGDLAFAFFGDAPLEGDEFVTKDARVPIERARSGAPTITAAPAWADLKLVEVVEKGDHAVVIAEVIDVGLREEAPDVLTLKELGLNYGG